MEIRKGNIMNYLWDRKLTDADLIKLVALDEPIYIGDKKPLKYSDILEEYKPIYSQMIGFIEDGWYYEIILLKENIGVSSKIKAKHIIYYVGQSDILYDKLGRINDKTYKYDIEEIQNNKNYYEVE